MQILQKQCCIFACEMQIKKLISEGEHQRQDFKYAVTNVSKIAHSLSAFANTDGGRLLIGVRDNGTLAGVQSDEEIYMIDAAATQCRPEVDCHMEVVREDGKQILIATIDPAPLRPVQCREEDGTYRAYIRKADENIVASPLHLELWRQLSGNRELTLTDSDHSLLQHFANGPLTLNQFCRKSGLKRHRAIRLLAGWIRYEILQLTYKEPQWLIHCQ